MKKVYILIVFATFFTTSIYAQNVAYKVGGGMFATYTCTDYGYMPGIGLTFNQRLEFKDSPFEIKNHISLEGINNLKLKFATHNIFKVGIMGEYNFLRFGHVNRFGEKWTPYFGVGGNFVYYHSAIHEEILEKDDISYYDEYTFGVRTSLGVKYKINKSFILSAETYIDWDFADKLDGWIKSSKNNDNSVALSISISYFL
jgi:hypothetical protein